LYYAHFGLTRPPFKITPDTDFFFEGGSRGEVLGALLYAISQGEGIVKVTGEVGSGKTMLCRVLQQRLGSTVDMIYLANPNISPDEILRAIGFELQIHQAREAPRVELIHLLQNYLVARHADGRRVVLFIEESQGMPLESLEEIRLLSNLETEQEKLLQIILFGQPELNENLQKAHIRQLRERITHSFNLAPLNRSEIGEYIGFRLRTAGYRGPALFPPKIVDQIAQASEGLTRRVNIIADKALLAAYAENTHTITAGHVRKAIADSEFSRRPTNKTTARGPRRPALVALIVAGAALAGWLIYDHFAARPAGPSSPVQSVTRPLAAAPAPAAVPQPEAAPPSRPALRLDTDLPAPPAAAAPAPAPVAKSAPQAIAPPAAPVPTPKTVQEPAPTKRADPPLKPATVDHDQGGLSLDALDETMSRRMRATGPWLASHQGAGYTIQLLGAADRPYLRQYLKNLPKSIDSESIFVYRKSAEARPSLTVIRGSYASPAEAAEAIEALPPEMRRFQPFLRSLRTVRTEFESVARVDSSSDVQPADTVGNAAER
jgi:MSHA biogenesis protein MshM